MRARPSAFAALFATAIGASTLTTALLGAPEAATATEIIATAAPVAEAATVSAPTAATAPLAASVSPTAFITRTWDTVVDRARDVFRAEDPRGQARARDLFYEGRIGEAREAANASGERWISGLASFRLRQYGEALAGFEAYARAEAGDPWHASAGAYWASRAAIAAGQPERAPEFLRAAARHGHTFYGQIAQRQLGLEPTGNPRLMLAAAQAGFAQVAAARDDYPMPEYAPRGGFTLDRAMVYAIVRQESRFNPTARSHAGATGLMQLMPGTASFITRRTGEGGGRLTDPAHNLRLGQDYFQYLLGTRICAEDILRAVAAYNGGPGTVLRTVEQMAGDTDALMLIESLPFSETRAYTERVMANYWIYRRMMGADVATLDAVASGAPVARASLDMPVNAPAGPRLLQAAAPMTQPAPAAPVQQISVATLLNGAVMAPIPTPAPVQVAAPIQQVSIASIVGAN